MSGTGLPIDAIVEILKRLRNKPLFRFKCVCKLWNHLISESWFIKTRHEYKTNRRRQLCFAYVNGHHDSIEYNFCRGLVNGGCGFRFTTADTQGNILDEFSLPAAPYIGCTLPYVIPTQLELACFYTPLVDDPKVYLFNPTTKRILHLPPVSRCEFNRSNKVGFGYSTRTDEYKVVHTYFNQFSSAYNSYPVWEMGRFKISCEIYSLEEIGTSRSSSSSSSCWKTINDKCPCPILNPASCIDDTLHWLSDYMIFETNVAVVSLNLNTEKFSIVPCTQQWRQDIDRSVELGDLVLLSFGKKLSVCHVSYGRRIRVWMIKAYNQGVWEEAYTINLVNVVDEKLRLPVFMINEDELLGGSSHLHHYYYHTKAKTFRTTKVLRPQTYFGFYLK